MKVGDIVKWCIVGNDEEPIIDFEYGIIIEVWEAKALVLFTDGTQDWIRLRHLVVISEA